MRRHWPATEPTTWPPPILRHGRRRVSLEKHANGRDSAVRTFFDALVAVEERGVGADVAGMDAVDDEVGPTVGVEATLLDARHGADGHFRDDVAVVGPEIFAHLPTRRPAVFVIVASGGATAPQCVSISGNEEQHLSSASFKASVVNSHRDDYLVCNSHTCGSLVVNSHTDDCLIVNSHTNYYETADVQ